MVESLLSFLGSSFFLPSEGYTKFFLSPSFSHIVPMHDRCSLLSVQYLLIYIINHVVLKVFKNH
jgi:hypothetical protein